MNTQMAYLLGMILGNGTISRGPETTTIVIDIPHKNLKDDLGRDVKVYVRSSIVDIRNIIEPLIGHAMPVAQDERSTRIRFTKPNSEYVMREILRFIGNGVHHSTMTMDPEIFRFTKDEKKELMRGIADVTAYIRKSNAYINWYAHRVYIEVPNNWNMVIDISNLLKELDVPVQTIDFGHPNFRDSQLKKYQEGKPNYWKKEHQIKIFANEFLPIGFNIVHKQQALKKFSDELLNNMTPQQTHKFYWEKRIRKTEKPIHPMESDQSLPAPIRGKHYDSWTELARELGYHE